MLCYSCGSICNLAASSCLHLLLPQHCLLRSRQTFEGMLRLMRIAGLYCSARRSLSLARICRQLRRRRRLRICCRKLRLLWRRWPGLRQQLLT